LIDSKLGDIVNAEGSRERFVKHTHDSLLIPMIDLASILFFVFRGGMQSFQGGAECDAVRW
jgi:hypothetical protein